jgi:hypothetical protein
LTSFAAVSAVEPANVLSGKNILTMIPILIPTRACKVRTALNTARVKAGLESGKFYYSRRFLNNKNGRLLVVLTVSGNTTDMQAFCNGGWVLPETKEISKLQRSKAKFFGYDHPDYSIMLV